MWLVKSYPRPNVSAKRLKRWAASIDRYGGQKERSLYQGLSSTSLSKQRLMARIRLNGASTIGRSRCKACKAEVEHCTRSASSSTAYIKPRASEPHASTPGFPATLHGDTPSASGACGIVVRFSSARAFAHSAP